MEDISGRGLTSAVQKGTLVKWVLANSPHGDSKPRPAPSVCPYAKQLGGENKNEKNPNCYCTPFLHSAATMDTLAAKLYQRRILWANCRNPHILICKIQAVSDPCKQKRGYGAFAIRGHTKDLWVVSTQCGGLCSAFDAISKNHLEICFAPPHTGASFHAFSWV